jgi:hypothetical protein
MATLALGLVGAAVGGAIGGGIVIGGAVVVSAAAVGFAIGGAIGSYIDANYLFAPDPVNINGSRLDDIVLQSATEGKGIAECFGRESRVGAQVLYVSPIRETERTETQGGGGKGGGGGVDVTRFSYDCDIALGICRGNIPAQSDAADFGDSGVSAIWANGKLVYAPIQNVDIDDTFDVTGSIVTRESSQTSNITIPFTQIVEYRLTIAEPSSGYWDARDAPDGEWFDVLIESSSITNLGGRVVQAYRNSAVSTDLTLKVLPVQLTGTNEYRPCNVGTAAAFHPGEHYLYGNGQNTSTHPYGSSVWPSFYTNNSSTTPFVPGCSIPGGATESHTIRVQTFKDPWKAGLIESATFYRGTQTTGNSLIANAKEGGGAAPSWTGIAYLVLQGLQLGDFGNSIPQFNFRVNKVGPVISGNLYGQTVDEVIESIMLDAGFSSDEFDVSGINPVLNKNGVYGYVTTGAQTLSTKLKPLMVWHDIRLREDDGVLYFFDSGAAPTTTASSSELGCKTEDEPVQQEFTTTDTADFRLPSEVNVTYYDRKKDLNQGSEKAQKVNYTDTHVRNLDSQMTSYAGKAQQRAAQILAEITSFRKTAKFRLPPDRIDVREGDVVSVQTSSGETFGTRVSKIDRGANYIHEVEGRIEKARFDDIDDDIGEDGGEGGQDGTYDPPTMTTTLWYGEAVRDSGTLQTEYVVAATPTDPTATFLGASVFVSTDYGTTYTQAGNIGARSAVIEAVTALGDHYSADIIDRVNTVDVKIYNGGSLSSAASEVEMLGGVNRAWLGEELIGWTTATQQSAVDGYPVYRLSGLLRNYRGQIGEDRMASHAAGEFGAVINNSGITTSFFTGTLPYGKTDTPIYVKVVPVGALVADVSPITFWNAAKSIRCFCPAHFEFKRFASALDNTSGSIANLPPLSFQTDDLIIRFRRRGRSLVPLFTSIGMPNLTNKEQFAIQVLDGSSIPRTLYHDGNGEITGSTNFPKYGDKFQVVYTAAQQVADFGSVQSSIDVGALQIGNLIYFGLSANVSG